MNSSDSIETRIAAWLGEEAATMDMPDRVVTATVSRTRGMRQAWAPRGLTASMRVRWLVVAAATLAIAALGIVGSGVLVPPPPPSVAPSASPTADTAAPATLPAVTGLPGRLAFARQTGGTQQIFVMRPDRTGSTQLTTGDAADSRPAWSPDGTKIAFVRTIADDSAVWVMDADGSNQVRLVGESGFQLGEPAWSPDGAMIAFTQAGPFGPAGGEGVYVMNADGSNVRPVLVFGDHEVAFPRGPVWMADSATLVLTGERDLFAIGIDGSEFRQLTDSVPEDSAGDVSPDGQWIAFQSGMNGGCIYRIHPDGTGLELLTFGCAKAFPMSYSPDGAYLAWAGGPHGDDDIHVIDADGGNERRLTESHDIVDVAWGP